MQQIWLLQLNPTINDFPISCEEDIRFSLMEINLMDFGSIRAGIQRGYRKRVGQQCIFIRGTYIIVVVFLSQS